MKKYKKILLLIGIILILGGCKAAYQNGEVITENVISLSTPWSSVLAGGWLSVIFNGFFVWPIAQVINYLSETVSLGPILSVIIATSLIKILVFALTFKSTISTQRMQEIQPDIQRIQDKYKDSKDPQSQQRMSLEVNKIYKENGISPMASLGVMFLQLPLMLAMYQAVQRSSAMIYGHLGSVSLMKSPEYGIQTLNWTFIIIFALMVVAQFVSMKLPQWITDSKKKKKPYDKKPAGGNSQNMMTYMMLVMVVVFAYKWPIGMTIYWLVNSILQIIQTWVVQKVILEKRENKAQ